ncbi:DUF937 domain-containing protein [Chryseobacterium gotjawalense]|uniref:DUF937 domain-containing protein n=1 Tax=Chryseobacterium gotjawalense TaxID=3042315 RepID=A0ABY8RBR9_9FLAO|nr:DUF937 domain-containing protein [Chryseobacterium sp. wdc7]WHF51124.1 DUF937 domain-containing protein [Chryseobacterium sp. wdc7]
MSLIDLITGNTGNQVAADAENKFGISKNQIIALLAVAAPLVISYLRKKSQDNPQEAEALNNALDKDHDGSILNDPSQAAARQQEGASILDHVFGSQKPDVENQLSEKTGISVDKIGPILAMLAPVIMGFIGKEKQATGVNSGGGLGDLLGGILGNATSQVQQQQAQGNSNPLTEILGSVLGSAKQGSSGGLGDILRSVLGGDQQSEGGLGGLLGSLFDRK